MEFSLEGGSALMGQHKIREMHVALNQGYSNGRHRARTRAMRGDQRGGARSGRKTTQTEAKASSMTLVRPVVFGFRFGETRN